MREQGRLRPRIQLSGIRGIMGEPLNRLEEQLREVGLAGLDDAPGRERPVEHVVIRVVHPLALLRKVDDRERRSEGEG